jgi:hypothetical protein
VPLLSLMSEMAIGGPDKFPVYAANPMRDDIEV